MKKAQSVILMTAFVLMAGCMTQRAWVYRSSSYPTPPSTSPKKVVVLPFKDMRENVNKNRIVFYAIPLMPFGWATYDAPEGADVHITSRLWVNYKPVEDFAKALAEELNATGRFQEAFFDFKKGDADLVIQGTIHSTKYEGKILSYGLSVYGPMLWLIGLPATTAANELQVELECVDLASENVVFRKRYEAPRYGATSWIYVLRNDFNYPSMLQTVYRQFIDDLANAIQLTRR